MTEFRILTGRSINHLTNYQELLISTEILDSFIKLKNLAKDFGIDLQIASAFRSYERQEKIWNEKVLGKRPILDLEENIIDITNLNEDQLLFAIIKYSALPGASRHHLGTDLDVFDANAISQDYKLQLTNKEFNTVFTKLGKFLEENLTKCDFFYPFAKLKLAPEPWHISHIKSKELLKEYSKDLLSKNISKSTFLLKRTALKHVDELYQDYIAA